MTPNMRCAAVAKAGAILLLMCAGQVNAQQGDLQQLIDGTFQYLKEQWPQTPTPVLTDTDVLEVSGGELLLGRTALERLRAASENGPHNTLITFYSAHEAWHSVQTSTLGEADIERLRASRVLECAADFMAATVTAQRMRALGASESERLTAGSRLGDYVRTHSTGSANAQYYPTAEMRALTIAFAWRYATDPGLVRWANPAEVPLRGRADEATAMRKVCDMAANVHDGSMGNIHISERRPQGQIIQNGSVPPASGNLRTMVIANFGDDPVVLSYMLVAQGFRRTGSGDELSHEIYDAIGDRIEVPPRGTIERSYSMKSYAPAGIGDGTHYGVVLTPYASASASGTFISSRYPPSRRQDGFCYERINGLSSSSDRALLIRLATVALAADEDFRPIASSTFVDVPQGARRFRLLGALQGDEGDAIRMRRGEWAPGPRAEIVAFRADSEGELLAELARLRQVMARACAMGNVVEDVIGPGEMRLQSFNIGRFAPKAYVQLGATMHADAALGRGGIVYFQIARDFSW